MCVLDHLPQRHLRIRVQMLAQQPQNSRNMQADWAYFFVGRAIITPMSHIERLLNCAPGSTQAISRLLELSISRRPSRIAPPPTLPKLTGECVAPPARL